MQKIIFATNNLHKLSEISSIIGGTFNLLSLNDIGFSGEIPETCPTIEENAIQKAKYIADRYSIACFADDTGLEVDALGGAPGVYSARYAGEKASYNDNVVKLLSVMKDKTNRKARFKTVIAFIQENKTLTFEGKIEGTISETPSGSSGFGYDPIFVPLGYEQSFAEMAIELKNTISHRALASKKLIDYLLTLPK